jgi:hypothetical protein
MESAKSSAPKRAAGGEPAASAAVGTAVPDRAKEHVTVETNHGTVNFNFVTNNTTNYNCSCARKRARE